MDRIRMVLRMVKAGPWSVGSMKWRMFQAHLQKALRLGALLALSTSAAAATHTAASPNRADVSAALSLCSEGDTLAIPAGIGTGYTTQLVIAKNIIIRGAGRDSTVIVNDLPSTSSPSQKAVWRVTVPGPGRITGIEFRENWSVGGGIGIYLQGARFWRINHCRFRQFDDRGIYNGGGLNAVVDHNHFIDCWSAKGSYGDQWTAWTRPLGAGSTNAVFFEDNYMEVTGSFYTPVGVDHGQGARGVLRFNVLSNLALANFDYFMDAHGNQGNTGGLGTGNAGTVLTESYGNFISVFRGLRGNFLRGGTHLHYDNTYKAQGGNWVTFNNTIVMTEEDGYRCGNILNCTYPGTHQITESYFFDQTFNGSDVTVAKLSFPGSNPLCSQVGCSNSGDSDGYFIQSERDYFMNTKPSTNFYVPLVYPHPRIVADNDPPLCGAFTLVSPANSATGVSIQPTLSWTDATAETGYRLQVSTNIFFSTRLVDTTLAAGTTSYSVPAAILANNTPYWWRVLGVNANGVRSGSDVQSFSFTTGGGVAVPGSIVIASASYAVNEDAVWAAITVNRVGGFDGAVSVNYGTTPGTAQPAVNYTTTAGTLNWANGAGGARTINVPILNDGVYSGPLTFTVGLSAPTGGATLGSPSATTVTINNVNPPPAPPLLPLTFFAYQAQITAPGLTNSAGEFYQPGETTAANGGRLAARVNIPTSRKWRAKGLVRAPTLANNSFFVDFDNDPPATPTAVWSIPLTAPTGTEERYVDWLGNGTSTSQFPTNQWDLPAGIHTIYFRGREANTFLYEITIEPVPIPGQIQLSSTVYAVNEDAGSIAVPVRRTNGSDGLVGMTFATADGTATAGVNYEATSGTLSWADGDTSDKTITINVLDDSIHGPDKTFTLTLTSPTGGADLGAPASAVITILNTTPPPEVDPGTIQLVVDAQGVNEDAGSVSIIARRIEGDDGAIGISYLTQAGTAVPGVNYNDVSGTLSWGDGDSADKSFSVPILDDGLHGPDVTFRAIVNTPTGGATLGSPSTNLVTVINVNPPVFPPTPQQVGWSTPGESAWEGSAIQFTVLRYSGTSGSVFFNYASQNGTAIGGVDYSPVSGTVELADGETSATIEVTLIDNITYASNKYFNMILSNPVNCSILGPADSLGVIIENDPFPNRGPITIRRGKFHRLIIGAPPP